MPALLLIAGWSTEVVAALDSLIFALNSLTPLAVIGLLAIIVYLLVKGRQQVTTITDNHLHDLPHIAETLDTISRTLQRMEVSQAENFSHLKARINGKD